VTVIGVTSSVRTGMSFGPLKDTGALRERYLRLTEDELPARATEAWPVQVDHCFQRIFLDILYGDVWYEHVKGRSAVRQLTADELPRATAIAESMRSDPARVRELNDRTLGYRSNRRAAPEARSGRRRRAVATAPRWRTRRVRH
jgi:hypothetical protein